MKTNKNLLFTIAISCILGIICFVCGMSTGKTVTQNEIKERVYNYFGEGDYGSIVANYIITGDSTDFITWNSLDYDSDCISCYPQERNFIKIDSFDNQISTIFCRKIQ